MQATLGRKMMLCSHSHAITNFRIFCVPCSHVKKCYLWCAVACACAFFSYFCVVIFFHAGDKWETYKLVNTKHKNQASDNLYKHQSTVYVSKYIYKKAVLFTTCCEALLYSTSKKVSDLFMEKI